MPVITFDGPELEQSAREELIRRFTEVAAEVVPNIPKEAYYVFIREHQAENTGVAGMVLPEYIKWRQSQHE